MRASKALTEGQRAGLLELPAGANPYDPGTTDHAEWERGRMATLAQKLERRIEAARRVA